MIHTCYNLWHLSPVTVWNYWKVSTGANINTQHMQAVCSKRSRLYSWGTHFESWPEYRLQWWSSRLSTVLPGEWESISCKATMAYFRIHWNMYILKYRQNKFTLEQTMKAHRKSRCTVLLICLTSALDGLVGQRHTPAAVPSGKRPGAHCTRGWVGLRAGGTDRIVQKTVKKWKILPMKDSLLSSEANRLLWLAKLSTINDISGACRDSVYLLNYACSVKGFFDNVFTPDSPIRTWLAGCISANLYMIY